MPSRDEVRDVLTNNGIKIVDESRLRNDTGWRLDIDDGTVVNVFDNGTVTPQGRHPERIRPLFAGGGGTEKKVASRNVFVVYGHDDPAKDQLEAMLRRWKLEPLRLDQLTSEGQTIIEKLMRYSDDCEFAVVLATPDDEGHRAEHPEEKAFRARQNVVLELGMMLAKLGRERVAILIKDQVTMERPSDIQGLIYIPFNDHISDAAVLLAKEMNKQGLTIDLDRL